jgi:hypothetical protein
VAVRRYAAAYLSNGTAKIEILGGFPAEPATPVDSLDGSLGAERYHHVCMNVADVGATLAELRTRGVEVLGDAIDLVAIDRRLGFFQGQQREHSGAGRSAVALGDR